MQSCFIIAFKKSPEKKKRKHLVTELNYTQRPNIKQTFVDSCILLWYSGRLDFKADN